MSYYYSIYDSTTRRSVEHRLTNTTQQDWEVGCACTKAVYCHKPQSAQGKAYQVVQYTLSGAGAGAFIGACFGGAGAIPGVIAGAIIGLTMGLGKQLADNT